MDHQALAQLLGNYGEFVGAIAVVVTLGYLAIQVRHGKEATEANTKAMNVQSYLAWQNANLQMNMAMSNPAQSQITAAGNADSANLTQETYVSFAMMQIALFQMAQSTDFLFRAGTLDQSLWEGEMNRAAGILRFAGVRQWWDAGGRTQLEPAFVRRLETIESTLDYWFWEPDRGFYRADAYGTPRHDSDAPVT